MTAYHKRFNGSLLTTFVLKKQPGLVLPKSAFSVYEHRLTIGIVFTYMKVASLSHNIYDC